MITKKWVELKIREHNERNSREIQMLAKASGFPSPGNNAPYRYPEITISQRADAICAYLGIEIVKEAKAEKIVAKKIKNAKGK